MAAEQIRTVVARSCSYLSLIYLLFASAIKPALAMRPTCAINRKQMVNFTTGTWQHARLFPTLVNHSKTTVQWRRDCDVDYDVKPTRLSREFTFRLHNKIFQCSATTADKATIGAKDQATFNWYSWSPRSAKAHILPLLTLIQANASRCAATLRNVFFAFISTFIFRIMIGQCDVLCFSPRLFPLE